MYGFSAQDEPSPGEREQRASIHDDDEESC